MPKNNGVTTEQYETEQIEIFDKMRENIQKRIEELEGALEGTDGFNELQQLRNDLSELESNIELWKKYRAQINENRRTGKTPKQASKNPSYLLRKVNAKLDDLKEKYSKEPEEKEQEEQSENTQEEQFESMTDEELENAIKDEWQFRAHQENGMEVQDDDSRLDQLMAEQNRRREEKNKSKEQFENMTDEELENAIKDEWQFRAHRENGMEGQDDDSRLDQLIAEQNRRREEKKKTQNPSEQDKGDKEEQGKEPEESKENSQPEGKNEEQKPLSTIDKKLPDVVEEKLPDTVDPEISNPNKKTPRHWVEIMAETQTQSSGSIMTAMHNMGKISPLKMGLTIWAAPVKLVMKGVGKLVGDGLGKVNTKKQEMVKNIRELAEKNPEEFDILVNGLTETNMRQYKVNEIYLDAVQEVLTERENLKKQEAINKDNAIKSVLSQLEDEINEIDSKLNAPGLLPNQKIDLQNERNEKLMQQGYCNMMHDVEYGKQVAADKRVQDFERGKVGKSTRKMNIQGWLAGSFNPDNRDVHLQEAELRKEIRECADRGDVPTMVEAQKKIDELHEDNTHVVQLLKGTRFESRAKINRGKHTVEEVHQKPNDADQTKGRELVATVMAAVTLANMVHSYQANNSVQQDIDNHLNEHNNQVNSINEHNRQVQQEINSANAQNAKVADQIHQTQSSISEGDLRSVGEYEIHRNNAATYSINHEREFLRDNTPGVGFNHGGSDDAIHAAQSGMTHARQAAENGSFDQFAQEVQNSASRMQKAAADSIKDVQSFTSNPGKAIFDNSEYVQNLMHLSGKAQDPFTMLSNYMNMSSKMTDPTQIFGTIQDVPNIGSFAVDLNSSTFTHILPFVTAMANVSHGAVQKNKMELDRQKEKKMKDMQKNKNENTKKEQENDNER